MTLIVNGLNMVPYIFREGLKWQRSDVDGPGAGRQLDGNLRRDRIGEKIRLDVTCRPLTDEQQRTVLQAITPEKFLVTYTDPQKGERTNVEMYSNNYSTGYKIKRHNGTVLWEGCTFPLIEL